MLKAAWGLWWVTVLCAVRAHEEQSTGSLSSSVPELARFAQPVPADFDYSCKNNEDGKKMNDFHLRGTALGGWLVLEPWITPSLFYQFLGATERWGDEAKDHVGIDSYTFCKALGPVEGNRQLRKHWATWVSEEQVANLAAIGVETLRIPVGDWMYKPYGPYIGCMDGALDELDRVLRLCDKYGMTAIIDIHALRGSQNGLDNSGDTDSYEWLPLADSKGGVARYHHWDIRGGSWAGHYNTSTFRYDSINSSHIEFTLDVVRELVKRHKNDPAVVGIEPVNEPWWVIPLDLLKQFYWASYGIVQAERPGWVVLFHDSFRLWPNEWSGFMKGCDNWALDTHIYQAWSYPNSIEYFEQAACAVSWQLWLMESIGIPVVVGEWSLATDNCAMWLNGFNDNVPGYPKVECERIECPEPYMGVGQPGAPPDKSKGAQDPFGEGGGSYVINGTCPRDKPFPDDLEVVRDLSYAKLNVFDQNTHGNFFWNFRTEFEPRWDYQAAHKNGWMPGKGQWASDSDTQRLIRDACPFKPKNHAQAPAPAPAPAQAPPSVPPPNEQPPVSNTPALALAEPDDTSNHFTANVWTATVAVFALLWVLVCCRRTQSLRGYMRVPDPVPVDAEEGGVVPVPARKRPVVPRPTYAVKEQIAV